VGLDVGFIMSNILPHTVSRLAFYMLAKQICKLGKQSQKLSVQKMNTNEKLTRTL